jgi:cytochrome c peroxidase
MGGGVFGFNNPSLFWDGRATFLPAMVLMPITNHVEMGMSDMNGIVEKVKSLKYYEDLFLNAFGAANVDGDKIASALSSFVSSIGSGNTRFDQARAGQVQLNALEEQGRNLFFNKYNCNSCHQTEQANGYEMGGGFVNIGLDAVYTDKGRQNVSNDVADNGKFKIPNLRNISLTGPYMHDGRFATLDQVLDHYSQGISGSPALDPRLKDLNGNPMRMNISTQEKSALKAFLGTLTDYKMITDPKYSNPFAAK